MTTFTPTEEQDTIIGLFAGGENMAVEAGAGTGKTSTLVLAGESTRRRGAYVAFNTAIVADAKLRMPRTVGCFTAHSLAMRQVGHRYRHRLGGPRLKSYELAKILRVDPFTVHYGSQRKVVQPSTLAAHVLKGIRAFCNTADDVPGPEHLAYIDGIDLPAADGKRTFGNNNEIRAALTPALARAWADLCNPDGALPFTHDHYLKMWQLGDPVIPGDFVLFDEAQDASPVMLDAVNRQDAQLVFVGDSCQQIYGWRGAENALGQVDAAHRAFLTQSWRFGPEIAGVANVLLDALEADLRLRGTPTIDSRLDELDTGEAADAVLCRSNARAIEELLQAIGAGRRPHLVGGGGEVLRFAKAAEELKATGQTGYPDLACFSTWGEVQDYVESDPQGSDLKLLVKLLDDFGLDTIVGALDGQASETEADVVVSTAHKSKGREWPKVRLATDFPDEHDPGCAEQTRLVYVACTRAMHVLDPSAVGLVNDLLGGGPAEPDDRVLSWVHGG